MGGSEIGITGAVFWAVATLVCFGSQTVHLKLPVVQRARAPWHLKFFFSLGTALVGVITAVYVSTVTGKTPFVQWGAYTALVWAPGTVCMLAATERIGVGLTIGLIAGISSIVSNITGITVLHDETPNVLAAVLAMLVLVAGVAALAAAAILGKQRRDSALGGAAAGFLPKGGCNAVDVKTVAQCVDSTVNVQTAEQDTKSYTANEEPTQESAPEYDPECAPVVDDRDSDKDTHRAQIVGGSCAALTGVLYGCQGLFMEHGDDDPLGTGASMMLTQLPLMTCIVLVRLSTMEVEEGRSRWKPQGDLRPQSVFLSLFGGMLFGVGFVGQNYVTDYFGAAVGGPLTQANLVVAGLWGICAFKEVRGVDLISLFAFGSALVLAGVTLLAVLK